VEYVLSAVPAGAIDNDASRTYSTATMATSTAPITIRRVRGRLLIFILDSIKSNGREDTVFQRERLGGRVFIDDQLFSGFALRNPSDSSRVPSR
jgi:hypothetical protein